MADQIGALGLDVSTFETGVNQAVSKLTTLAHAASITSAAITATGAAIAIWSRNIIDAKERADLLKKSIQEVGRVLSGPEFNTESGLETRLKEVDALLEKLSGPRPLSDIVIQGIADFYKDFQAMTMGGRAKSRNASEGEASEMALNKRKEIETQLADKIDEQTYLIEIQNKEGNKAVELEKLRLDYAEKRGKLANTYTDEQRAALIWQEALKKSEIERKYAIAASNAEFDIASGKRKELQKEVEEGNKLYLEDQEKRKKATRAATELEFDLMKSRRDELRQQIEDGNKLYLDQLKRNKATNEELENQQKITALKRTGNDTAVRREEMEQSYEEKIKIAKRDNNDKGVRMLEEERNVARAGFDVEESKKTPRERANERKARRQIESNEAKAAAQNAELDERIKKGAHGDADSRLEQRRTENIRRAGHDKQSIIPAEKQGWTDANTNTLNQIRDSLTNKDG